MRLGLSGPRLERFIGLENALIFSRERSRQVQTHRRYHKIFPALGGMDQGSSSPSNIQGGFG
jgi:hypothetical protein